MAKFSRQHYEMIAECLRENVRKDRPTIDEDMVFFDVVRELSEMFDDDNRNFDPARFWKAAAAADTPGEGVFQ